MLVFETGQKDALHSVAFAPDGGSMVAAAQGCVYLWRDLAVRKASARTAGCYINTDVRFSADGNWLFGAGLFLYRFAATDLAHNEVDVWNNTGTISHALHPTEPLVLVAGNYRPENVSRIGLWRAADTRPEAALWRRDFPPTYLPPLFLPGGERFVRYELTNAGARFAEYATDTGAPTGAAHPVTPMLLSFLMSPNGTTLAGRGSNFVELWELAGPRTRHLGRIRNTSKKHFTGAAFHPNGHLLALTSNDATVKLFDVATRSEVKALVWNAGRMRSVCFSPDGALAAAGTDKGQVIVWDVDA